MKTSQADILVYGKSNSPLAVVEVKNLPQMAASQASDLRKSLLETEVAPEEGAYLLVVSQDVGFLWTPTHANGSTIPDAQFEMRPVLREYLAERELSKHLRGSELELAIMQWLSDLSRGSGVVPGDQPAMSQFAQEIRGARIESGSHP